MTKQTLSFGEKVAKARKSKGWTQLRFALESGIAKSYISEIETGKRNPTLNEMYRIAVALGVRLNDLIDF